MLLHLRHSRREKNQVGAVLQWIKTPNNPCAGISNVIDLWWVRSVSKR
jgi:hypothetical protein